MSDKNDDSEFFQIFNRSLDRITSGIFLWGNQPQDENPSTFPAESSQTPLTAETLSSALRDLKNADPLLQKGVQKDWVCVLNPALVSHIKELYKTYQPKHFTPFNELDYIMGRPVYIINEASLNIEYMDYFTMRFKYQAHFERENEAAFNMIIDKRLEFLYQRRETTRKHYYENHQQTRAEWEADLRAFNDAVAAYIYATERYGREALSAQIRRDRY